MLVAITVLVFVHELGHFLTAKLFGMRVERFSIGFPPKIIGKQVGETEYVIGATPLGGYVKIAGMVDESLDAEYENREPEPWEYRAKPVWQRMIVISAGVIFNVILAIFIFAGIKMANGETYIPAENVPAIHVQEESMAYEMGLRTGDQLYAVGGRELERLQPGQGLFGDTESYIADIFTVTVIRDADTLTFQGPEDLATQMSRLEDPRAGLSFEPAIVGATVEEGPAYRAGLQSGDRIIEVGGEPISFWGEMTERVMQSDGEPMTFRWMRPDSLLEEGGDLEEDTAAEVRLVEERDDHHIFETELEPEHSEEEDRYVVGIYHPPVSMLASEFGIETRTFGPLEAMASGTRDAWVNTRAIAVSLQRLVTGREGMDSVGGPVMVAKVAGDAASAGPSQFWFIVAILSVTLAIVNILPVPALDGGHLAFLFYEAVTRREPSLRVRMALQQIGMLLLLLLIVFLIFHDILRLI